MKLEISKGSITIDGETITAVRGVNLRASAEGGIMLSVDRVGYNDHSISAQLEGVTITADTESLESLKPEHLAKIEHLETQLKERDEEIAHFEAHWVPRGER